MIKSSVQLKNAEQRLSEIQRMMFENSKTYSELDLELHNYGLETEEGELLRDIIEYKNITALPFTDAVSLISSKPILIDNIGDLLSKLRIAAKLSQAEMAQRLGWQQSNLSRFENENYGAQSISKVVEYASALGIWLHVSPSLTEEPATIEKTEQPQRKIIKTVQDTSVTSTEDSIDFTYDNDAPMSKISDVDVTPTA